MTAIRTALLLHPDATAELEKLVLREDAAQSALLAASKVHDILEGAYRYGNHAAERALLADFKTAREAYYDLVRTPPRCWSDDITEDDKAYGPDLYNPVATWAILMPERR